MRGYITGSTGTSLWTNYAKGACGGPLLKHPTNTHTHTRAHASIAFPPTPTPSTNTAHSPNPQACGSTAGTRSRRASSRTRSSRTTSSRPPPRCVNTYLRFFCFLFFVFLFFLFLCFLFFVFLLLVCLCAISLRFGYRAGLPYLSLHQPFPPHSGRHPRRAHLGRGDRQVGAHEPGGLGRTYLLHRSTITPNATATYINHRHVYVHVNTHSCAASTRRRSSGTGRRWPSPAGSSSSTPSTSSARSVHHTVC